MKQDPTANDLYGGPPNKQCQLGKENQIDKMNVLVFYPDIHDALGQKGKNELEQTRSKQSNNQLPEKLFVLE